jgi:hypothetical protein
MPFYMENFLGQLDAIRRQGAFYLTCAGDLPLASIATRDIASTAASLLTDLSWTGQENLPVFGPDRLTPDAMAEVISRELGHPVAYHRMSMDDFASLLRSRGASDQSVKDRTEMFTAQDHGIYDADWATASPPQQTSARGAEKCSSPPRTPRHPDTSEATARRSHLRIGMRDARSAEGVIRLETWPRACLDHTLEIWVTSDPARERGVHEGQHDDGDARSGHLDEDAEGAAGITGRPPPSRRSSPQPARSPRRSAQPRVGQHSPSAAAPPRPSPQRVIGLLAVIVALTPARRA